MSPDISTVNAEGTNVHEAKSPALSCHFSSNAGAFYFRCKLRFCLSAAERRAVALLSRRKKLRVVQRGFGRSQGSSLHMSMQHAERK